LIHKFSWMTYVFGIILVYSAAKLMTTRHDTLDPEEGALVKFFRKRFQVTDGYVGTKFFVTENGIRKMTPLFLVLLVIETTDLLFAVDSIPAIFAITTDPYIVFTSNICAILGLRSLYFALAALMDRFRYIRMSLVFVLAYVGIKMILSHAYPIPTPVSLAVIGTIILVGIIASLRATRLYEKKLKSPLK
jgi:tellurite resistance protein TerC